MDKTTQQKVFTSYMKLILISSVVQLVFRFYETFLVIINFGIQDSLFISEIKGLVFDLILTGSILAVAFPLYYLVYRFSEKFVFNLFSSHQMCSLADFICSLVSLTLRISS